MKDIYDQLMPALLMLDDNETNLLNIEDRQLFTKMLILLQKIRYDIRYCRNEGCNCRPEVMLKELFEQSEELVQFLVDVKVYDKINEYLAAKDTHLTVFDLYGAK